MENFRKELGKLKPILILITYAIVLIFIILNMDFIVKEIKRVFVLLNPFLLAIVIAYVLNIPMSKIETYLNKKFKSKFLIKNIRGISIFLTLSLAFSIIIFFGSIIVPQLITTTVTLFRNMSDILNSIVANTGAILSFFNLDPLDFEFSTTGINNFFNSFGLDFNKFLQSLTNVLGITSQSFLSYLSVFFGAAANWFLAIMLSLYLLGGKETFIRQIKKLIAALFSRSNADRILRYSKLSNDIFSSFVGGQLLEALIIGLLIYVALLVTGMPYSILIAAIASVMALVPVLGPTIACVVGFLLVLSVSPVKALWFVIIYQAVQQLENTLIYPKIVGKSVGLPGIWTLLSIVVFGGLFGVVGMLLAVPLTALIYTTGSTLINKILLKKKLIVTTKEIKDMP